MTKYLFAVGIEGIEWIIDLTEVDQEDRELMAQKLTNPESVTHKQRPSSVLVERLSLRARFNNHRNIRSFIIIADDMDADDLERYYKANPAGFIKLLEEKNCEIRI